LRLDKYAQSDLEQTRDQAWENQFLKAFTSIARQEQSTISTEYYKTMMPLYRFIKASKGSKQSSQDDLSPL
jgi:hypothetical protein